MSEDQTPPQQQTVNLGSAEGLQRFYALYGQQAHALCEANVQIEIRNAKLKEVFDLYGPKPDATTDEPTPIAEATRKKAGGG